ncbi:sensor histidine kinase [Pedobacter agri]|uniref:histidine kinase n=1 Tax=Pedobacter agri TaxID=454586 RepID=A0A9X3DHE9_9SPHI|nr:PAS domain-containing sensor histidine kinase [Pedobacter agri]MCX3267245.1 PAS domain-containing sensor histidine kinase [Pedobacter agri]
MKNTGKATSHDQENLKNDFSFNEGDHLSSLSLLNALPQQVWTAGSDGKIDYVNDTICRDFGYPQALIIESGWEAFVHPEDITESIERWQEALNTEKEYVTEFRLRFTDGQYYWHLARAVLVKRTGKPSIWVGTNTNIQSHKDIESRKDEFISIASHELKTPLTSIRAYNQVMLRKASDGTIKDYLLRTQGQLARLEKLIKDLLDVSKINAGKMSLNLENFNFSEMLRDAISAAQSVSTKHKIILTDELNLEFTGDHYRLEQVVQNFLSNAVKYSPEADRVLVSTNIKDGNVIVSVTDFGIGIERSHLGRLFDRYYRADNSSSRFDGLGLGLFISAEIIKRHGGSFWIESELGKGATFFFKLPLEADHPIQPEIKTKINYKDRYLSISCPQDDDIMYVEWTGHQDMRSVKHGGALMIEYFKANPRSKVFNDNRLVLGTWSEASDWAAEVWLPLMELAGLKYLAWIFSASAFSQLSAQKSVDNEEKTSEILFFYQADEALTWLRNINQK